MNRGSATLKSALYEAGNHEELLLSMTVDQAGVSGSRLKIADASGTTLLDSTVNSRDTNAALEGVLAWLDKHGYLSSPP
jgi:acetate kinase